MMPPKDPTAAVSNAGIIWNRFFMLEAYGTSDVLERNRGNKREPNDRTDMPKYGCHATS